MEDFRIMVIKETELTHRRTSGEQKYDDDATSQILNFTKILFDPKKKLFYHGWNEELFTHGYFRKKVLS